MNAKTDTTIYNGHRSWYLASGVAALIGLIVASIMVWDSRHAISGWETSLFHAINKWPESYKTIGLAVTIVGGSVWTALASIIITMLCKMYRLSWRLAAVIIGGYGLDFILKEGIDRGRPADMLAEFHRRSVETGAGFPSGHTTIATVIAVTLIPYLPKKLRWIPFVWIAAVALSRIYLGVHLPLDVIGGLLVGLLVVSIIRVMPQSWKVFFRLD
jgi:membrane-associated phospholipid phosphatase